MPNIVVKAKVRVPSVKEIESRVKGAKFKKLLDDIAKDMGDQARINIRKFGAPGGKWPQLSGFNGNSVDAKIGRIKDRAMRSGMSAGEARALAAEEARKERAARRKKKVTRHIGYAREKERDRDKGKIPYGPADRLTRTGTLRAAMDGEVILERARVEMVARGDHGDGMSNQELFVAHATGEGNLPVRNPAEDMTNFLERTRRRIEAHLAAPMPSEEKN